MSHIPKTPISLDEVYREIVLFNDRKMGNWREWKNLVFISNAIAGEVGEVCDATTLMFISNMMAGKTGKLCDALKKLYGGGTNRANIPTKEDCLIELFDIFVYMVLFIELSNSDLDDFKLVAVKKLEELYARMNDQK